MRRLVYEDRVRVEKPANAKDVWVLAGRKENGQAAILVSCFDGPAARSHHANHCPACQIKLQLENRSVQPEKCTVSVLDDSHNLQPLDGPQVSGSEITLSKPAGAAVFLVELP